jgi:hypothetical protein
MPVLLGAGLRLFENTGVEGVVLEKIRVQKVGAITRNQLQLPTR